MNTIISQGREYIYEEMDLSQGMKEIDRDISKSNILEIKTIFDRIELGFGIIYGTLLGAVRENDFIKHDQDIDVFMLSEDKEKFVNILFELRDNGFELIRYGDDLLSIIKDGEYIDIYFFKKSLFFYRKNSTQYVLKSHLEKTEYIDFFEVPFRVPSQHIVFLEKHYGKDWRIPIKNKPAKSSYFTGKYKKLIKSFFKSLN